MPTKSKAKPSAPPETRSHEEVQAAGYRGVLVDPTPNAHYGVTGGPTPETDSEWAKQVDAHVAGLEGDSARPVALSSFRLRPRRGPSTRTAMVRVPSGRAHSRRAG